LALRQLGGAGMSGLVGLALTTPLKLGRFIAELLVCSVVCTSYLFLVLPVAAVSKPTNYVALAGVAIPFCGWLALRRRLGLRWVDFRRKRSERLSYFIGTAAAFLIVFALMFTLLLQSKLNSSFGPEPGSGSAVGSVLSFVLFSMFVVLMVSGLWSDFRGGQYVTRTTLLIRLALLAVRSRHVRASSTKDQRAEHYKQLNGSLRHLADRTRGKLLQDLNSSWRSIELLGGEKTLLEMITHINYVARRWP
jgi:hypothetical protein